MLCVIERAHALSESGADLDGVIRGDSTLEISRELWSLSNSMKILLTVLSYRPDRAACFRLYFLPYSVTAIVKLVERTALPGEQFATTFSGNIRSICLASSPVLECVSAVTDGWARSSFSWQTSLSPTMTMSPVIVSVPWKVISPDRIVSPVNA